jgi:hypothetical protein
LFSGKRKDCARALMFGVAWMTSRKAAVCKPNTACARRALEAVCEDGKVGATGVAGVDAGGAGRPVFLRWHHARAM